MINKIYLNINKKKMSMKSVFTTFYLVLSKINSNFSIKPNPTTEILQEFYINLNFYTMEVKNKKNI